MVRWFLQNAPKRLLFAARHPAYALRALVRELTLADERFLAAATGAAPAAIRAFLDEPFNNPAFAAHLRQHKSAFDQLKLVSANLYAKKVLIQYAAIRAVTPDVVVETGVANGVSTAYVLLALEQNARGMLHSVELGDASFLPPGRPPGWAVPEWLRARWTLHLGDAETLLPRILAQLGTVDIFIHDSLHSYEHMCFEFLHAYQHLKAGGLLLADDALWNGAFRDFAQAKKVRTAMILRGVGVLKKESS